MTLRTIKTAFIVLLSLATVFSCKEKEEETPITPSLEGSVKFKSNIPAYILQGTALHFAPKGVVHPEGGEVGYYYRISPKNEAQNDTIKLNKQGDTTIVFKGEEMGQLETYTITCTAFAKGYSSISSTAYVTVVKKGLDGNGSITGVDTDALSGYITDPRNIDPATSQPKVYFYTTVGKLDWLALNMAYEDKDNPIGLAYEQEETLRDFFGGYYTYTEAQRVCPTGWRLPSVAEWETLPKHSGDLMAKVHFNGTLMWEFWPEVKISNSTGFSAIPSGEANIASSQFTGIFERAVFWTSDTKEDKGVVKYIIVDKPEVYTAYVDKESFGASVRCVRDHK